MLKHLQNYSPLPVIEPRLIRFDIIVLDFFKSQKTLFKGEGNTVAALEYRMSLKSQRKDLKENDVNRAGIAE